MAYLGRPSEGESPFAIADRAMRDHTSPQPPQQRNPTPRQAYRPQAGSMAAPSPYGSVSDEARRRYEERYARKAAEEQAKREAEMGGGQAPPPQQQQRPQQAGYAPPAPPPQPTQSPVYNQQQQQQYARPPPRGDSYGQHPQQPPPINTQQFQQPPPRSSSAGYGQPASPAQAYAQQYQAHHGQQPQQRPPSQQQQHQQYAQQQRPAPQQQQQYQQQQGQGPAPQRGVQLSDGPPPQQQQQYQQQQQNRQSVQSQPPQQQQQQQQRQSVHSQHRDSYQAPPPQAGVDDLRNLFAQFDSTRQGQLSYLDLERLLAKDGTVEAREDCVKMLMNIFDTDRSGSINFMEFEGLYRYIQDWHGIFKRFDQDNSGLIDRRELQAALQGFGFTLPSDMVAKLEKRFAPPLKPGERQSAGITFDRFLMACVTVKHYTEAFRRLDPNNVGQATMDYMSFMDIVMDAPS